MSFARVLAHIHRAPVLAGMDRMQPDMRTLATELLERFALKQEAPLAAAVEGAALALWGVDWRADPSPVFLEWYRSTGGVARALEVLLAALAYERRSYEWNDSVWALRRARPAQGLSNLGLRPWLWMRRAMDEAAQAERAAAVEIANRASRAWHVRAALAFVFPDDDTRWTPADRAELRHAEVDHDHVAVRFGVLAAMRKARFDHARLAHGDPIGEAGLAEIAKSPDAVAALRLSRAYRELAALGDPDGLRALLELADADEAWEVIAKLPRTAATMAALAPMFTTQRPRRLLGLHLAHGFLVELVSGAADEAAQVDDPYVARLLAETGARLPADDGWVSPWAKPVKKSKKQAEAPAKAAPLRDVAFLDQIHWAPGEREQAAQLHEREGENLDAEIEKRTLAMGKADKAFVGELVWVGNATALKLWRAIEPAHWYAQTDDIEHLLARFGLEELASIVAFVRSKPDTMAALSRVESPQVAPLMARGFALVKKMEKVGRAWLETYPEAAALGLLRDTDGDKKQRDANAKALAHVAAKFPAIVERITAELGADTKATELTAAGAPQLPGRAPKLPDFVELASLPRPIAGDTALQGAALGELVQLLAATLPGGHPILDAAAARYTEASLSRFAWSLFRQWLFAGAPPKHKWAMYAVGRFPDDANAKALGRLARVWAPRGNSARAQEAVEALATMRTQTGLIEIHEIATKVQSKALQARAETVFETVATSLGLGAEELADRLVPELSEAELTFGDLRATFDTSLVPSLVAADGTTFDKPRDAEDVARWKALEKMCKPVARTQLARLEQLLADGHRMPYAHFSEIYLMHSLIRHLARGLVWGAYQRGTLERAFAISADGPVGLDGKPLELAIDAGYGVVHPVELAAADRAAWRRHVPAQPFAQLARETFPADSGMEVSLILAKLISRMITTGKLMELQRRGWRRGEAPQGGRYYSIERAGKGWTAELAFTPGIYLGNPLEEPTQVLEAIAFFAEPDVPKAVLSEIQRDVRGLLME